MSSINSSSNDEQQQSKEVKSDISQNTALSSSSCTLTTTTSTTLPSPNTASTTTTTRPTIRRNELSYHMENARKGVVPPFSEMGRKISNPATLRRSNSKTATPNDSDSESKIQNQISNTPKLANTNKENRRLDENKKSLLIDSNNRKIKIAVNSNSTPNSNSNNNNINNISSEYSSYKQSAKTNKRVDEIIALTHETLARVDNLVNKRDNNKCDISKWTDNNLINDNSKSSSIKLSNKSNANSPSSILKKKSIDESVIIQDLPAPSANNNNLPTVQIPSAVPVSILKRKVSTDESTTTSTVASSSTPVTFSPNVIEPTTTNRKQGILKKRRSLDESQVLRHRSCSPDVASFKSDSRSILKNQRRSSLEEIIRIQSPDATRQGILKRRTSKHEEEYDHSLSSPQSILKRRSGASSAGSSTTNTGMPHVSITTAVILAAAGGAEMILENETVRPILKKKSLDDLPYENAQNESLKPILKKKSSTDTDDTEERPRPILKLPKNQEQQQDDSRYHSHQNSVDSGSECEVRPILKRDDSSNNARPRLSFCREDDFVIASQQTEEFKRSRNFRRPNTICTDFNLTSNGNGKDKEGDRELRKPRPLSVFELARKFESKLNTGAIPKRSPLHKRNNDRSRTQPVTYNEFEAR